MITKWKNGCLASLDVGICTDQDTFIGFHDTLEQAKKQCQKYHEENK